MKKKNQPNPTYILDHFNSWTFSEYRCKKYIFHVFPKYNIVIQRKKKFYNKLFLDFYYFLRSRCSLQLLILTWISVIIFETAVL